MCLWQKVFVVALLLVSRYGMADLIGVDFGPSGNTPMHWTSITGKGNFSNLTTDEGVRTTVGLYVSRDGEPYNVSPNPATLPRYKHDLGALDGNVYRFGGVFDVQITGLKPLQPYDLYVFGLRGGAPAAQAVAVGGGRGLSFSQSGPEGALIVNDQVGSSARELSHFAKRVTASHQGAITINVTGGSRADQTFALAGLAIEGEFPGLSAPVASTAPASNAAESQPQGLAAGQPQGSGPDVIGVRLGMSLDLAMSTVAQAYPEIPLQKYQWHLGQVQKSRIHGGDRFDAGFQGSYQARGRNEFIQVSGYLPPNDGIVGGIARYTYTGEMLLADLLASLVEKYGEPVLVIQPNTVLRKPHLIYSWSRDRSGEPLRDPAAVIQCVYQRHGNPWEQPAQVTLWDTKEAFNGQFDRCGWTMAVLTMASMGTPVVTTGFGVVLFDFNEIRRTARMAWERTDAIAQALEAEKEEQLSGQRPRL